MNKTYNLPTEFTVNEVAQFKEELYHDLENQTLDLLIDCTNCTFIDSTGLGAIVSVFKRLNENSGTLALRGMSPPVRELFVLTRLDHVLDILD